MTDEQIDRLIAALERLGATVERLAPTPVERLQAKPVATTHPFTAWCGRCGTKVSPGQTHQCTGITYTQSHPLRLA